MLKYENSSGVNKIIYWKTENSEVTSFKIMENTVIHFSTTPQSIDNLEINNKVYRTYSEMLTNKKTYRILDQNDDLDLIKEEGNYFIQSGVLNTPNNSGWGMMSVLQSKAYKMRKDRLQLFTQAWDLKHPYKIRHFDGNSGKPSPWKAINIINSDPSIEEITSLKDGTGKVTIYTMQHTSYKLVTIGLQLENLSTSRSGQTILDIDKQILPLAVTKTPLFFDIAHLVYHEKYRKVVLAQSEFENQNRLQSNFVSAGVLDSDMLVGSITYMAE